MHINIHKKANEKEKIRDLPKTACTQAVDCDINDDEEH